MTIQMKKGISIVAICMLLMTMTLSGCRQKEAPVNINSVQGELTIYNVFDNEDIFDPMIEGYIIQHPQVKINYRKFSNLEEYRELIVNELAEGEGPDIFFLHNSWFYRDHKKLEPAPEGVSVEDFKNTFVDITAEDLVQKDKYGRDRIYSLPLYVDTLALYYNRTYFNEMIPEKGKPSQTWSELKEDLFKLKKEDNSFERFKVAGIAMGRADNVLRSFDILLSLFLQHGTEFYNESYDRVTFANEQGINSFGRANTPGMDALQLYTEFALPNSRHYTWNSVLSDASSAEKEVETFARGKVAMVLGYSYLYEELVRQINVLSKKNSNIIEVSDIAVTEIPQVFDPDEGIGPKATLASYFAPGVARTSQNKDLAWNFIGFMSSQENVRFYHEKTHRPPARRDLIQETQEHPIYGPFVKQIGYAKTIPMVNPERYQEIFEDMITQVIETLPPQTALKVAQERIKSMVPNEGLYPAPLPITTEE